MILDHREKEGREKEERNREMIIFEYNFYILFEFPLKSRNKSRERYQRKYTLIE